MNRSDIRTIVLVGAWQGSEIPGLLRRYRNTRITAFEPSDANFRLLSAQFENDARVRCYQLAVSDQQGSATFHDGTLPGTGSLLPFADDWESRTHNVGLREARSFAVAVTTLDDHEAIRELERVDLLKIDVQGAESRVLRGGAQCLRRTSAVLIEVGRAGSAYAGASTFEEVDRCLQESGLLLCGLGLDPITLDGNALYVRTAMRHRHTT